MSTFIANVFFYLIVAAFGLVLVKREFKNPLVERQHEWGAIVTIYFVIAGIVIAPAWFAFICKNPAPVFLMAVALPMMFREIYAKGAEGYERAAKCKCYGRVIGSISVLGTLNYLYYQAVPMSISFWIATTIATVWTLYILRGLRKQEYGALKTSRVMANVRHFTCKPFNRKAYHAELEKKRKEVDEYTG